MPFQKKYRKCDRCFGQWTYKPAGKRIATLTVTKLNADELESMRLCDGENLSQKEAADLMEISTGTLQRLVYSARKKVVDALCNQQAIELSIPDNIKFKNNENNNE